MDNHLYCPACPEHEAERDGLTPYPVCDYEAERAYVERRIDALLAIASEVVRHCQKCDGTGSYWPQGSSAAFVCQVCAEARRWFGMPVGARLPDGLPPRVARATIEEP